jgi:hypothetical protein
MDELEKNQYLRHLLMLKTSFIQMHDNLLLKKNDELLLLLSSSISVVDNKLEDGGETFFGVTPKLLPKINKVQEIGVFLFGLLFKPLMNENQLVKLKASPQTFFTNSNNALVRLFGLLLNLKE